MYYKPDDNLISRFWDNRKNIAAGRISHGYTDIMKYQSVYGIVVGILFGIVLVIPQVGDRTGDDFFISYDNFWPVFITMIIITIVIGVTIERGIKYHALKKMIYNQELVVDNGTILYTTVNRLAKYGVIETDYKTPIPHFLDLPYVNPKKPRSLKTGTRVYILKTPDSICIIPMSDITGAPMDPEISYKEAYDIKDINPIYHPNVFDIDSTPVMITDENRRALFHEASRRSTMYKCLNTLKVSGTVLGILVFVIFCFHNMLPIDLKYQIIGSIGIIVIAAMIVWMGSTFKIINKLNKADHVKTVMVELPKAGSWTGDPVVQIMENANGEISRKTFDIRNCSGNFKFFDTVQVFYKKDIDAVQTIC